MFFIGKLLAFLPFGNLLRGSLGKIVIGGAIVSALGIGIMIWLATHDASIRNTAALKFNQSQLNQTIKDQQKFNHQMTTLLQEQQSTLNDINKQRSVLNIKSNNLITNINSGKFKGGKSSEVLRHTVKILGGN